MNYIDDISIYGMMNKNCTINSAVPLSFYKTKNHKKAVVFNSYHDIPDCDEVSYMYMDEQPDFNDFYSMEDIVSIIDPYNMFVTLPGKYYREIRETVNYWKDKIVVKHISETNYQEIIDMIEKWRYLDCGGMKYHWQEHAGIDKAIVTRYVNREKIYEQTIGTVFYYNDECIGYSIIENNPSEIHNGFPKYNYLTRKVIPVIGRNITEYIDWYTFKNLSNKSTFLIDWGCSSGGVHWYKTHKWPVYSLEKKYFYKVKKDGK